jgi:hypothetical protein
MAPEPEAGGPIVAGSAEVRRGTDTYDYDPDDPTPFLWSRNVDSGVRTTIEVEGRKDVLVLHRTTTGPHRLRTAVRSPSARRGRATPTG